MRSISISHPFARSLNFVECLSHWLYRQDVTSTNGMLGPRSTCFAKSECLPSLEAVRQHQATAHQPVRLNKPTTNKQRDKTSNQYQTDGMFKITV